MYREEFSEATRQLIENELEKSIFHGFGHLIRGTGISKLPEPLKYILGRREMRSIVTFETDFMEAPEGPVEPKEPKKPKAGSKYLEVKCQLLLSTICKRPLKMIS